VGSEPIAQLLPGRELGRSAGSQDRAVHAAAVHQPAVCGVDDGVDVLSGDVASYDGDANVRHG
jgi:hypothetical protein